jgi:hypothetical protein
MKLDLKDITTKITPLLQKAREYSGFIIVLVVLGLFGFVVLRIRSYATIQPTQAAIDEKLQDLKRTRIDEDAIEKIQKLESSNIDVKALFDDARDNPFQE